MKLLPELVGLELEALAPKNLDLGQLILIATQTQARMQERLRHDAALRRLVEHFAEACLAGLQAPVPNGDKRATIGGSLALAIMLWEDANHKFNEQLQTKP